MGNEKKKKAESATTTNNKNGRKIITDPRFSSLHSDPRFQKVPTRQSKVAIDSRFNRMFTDKNFASSSAPVDKRGKATNQNSVNPLRHYYNIEEEEESKKKQLESEDEEGSEDIKNLNKVDSDSDSDDEFGSDEQDELGLGLESDETNSDTDDDDEVYYEEPEEPEEKVTLIDHETHRLAIVNLDWNQFRAVDLYAIMNSFLPKGGKVLSVSVYPTEFGLKRMEEEAVKGPVGLFDSDNEMSEDEGEDEIDNEKLRAYEKSRLRYYHAVVECDSIATADYVYKSCDGMEYERSSNVLDLRFIPDTMQFEHPPRDVATEVPTNYVASVFQTDALQQSQVKNTWDEDEPKRVKTLRRKFNPDQIAESEFADFLASDDGDSDDDDDDENNGAEDGKSDKKLKIKDRYRSLVQSGDGSDGGGSEDDIDMEVTFNTGLEEISKRILERKKDEKSETVWEARLRRQKEKKKARKNRSKDSSDDESSGDNLEAPEEPDDFFLEGPASEKSKAHKSSRTEKQEQDTDKAQEASRAELELLLADDQGDDRNVKGYNLKRKKPKGKKGKEEPAEDKLPSVDYNDSRFSAMFTSPLFALDPTDAQYKRSAAYARQMAQKQQKGEGLGDEIADKEQARAPRETQLLSYDIVPKESEQLHSNSMSTKMENTELSSMIRSLKRKSQQHQTTSSGNASKKAVPMQSRGLLPKLSSMFLSGKKKARHSKG